jgi:cytochrome c oxidase assembly factor CtaG
VADGLLLVAVACAYGVGLHRLRCDTGPEVLVRRGEVWSFAAGMAAAAVALSQPVDGAVDHSLTVHMVQHVVLLSVAAPLLAVGAPLPTLLWALPAGRRGPGLRLWGRAVAAQRGARWFACVAAAVVLQSVVMWGWHAPALFGAALRHPALHALEHASFLATSVAMWWVLTARRSRRGAAALAVFVASFPGTALGAALLLAPRPWYPEYVQTTTAAALGDQQTAGVVMWAFVGLVYVVAAAVLFATWMADGHGMEEPEVMVPPWPGPAGRRVGPAAAGPGAERMAR